MKWPFKKKYRSPYEQRFKWWPLMWKHTHLRAVADKDDSCRRAIQRHEEVCRERERVAEEITKRFYTVQVRHDAKRYHISQSFDPQILNWGSRADQEHVVNLMIRNIEREIKRSVFVRAPDRMPDGSHGWSMGGEHPGL